MHGLVLCHTITTKYSVVTNLLFVIRCRHVFKAKNEPRNIHEINNVFKNYTMAQEVFTFINNESLLINN